MLDPQHPKIEMDEEYITKKLDQYYGNNHVSSKNSIIAPENFIL